MKTQTNFVYQGPHCSLREYIVVLSDLLIIGHWGLWRDMGMSYSVLQSIRNKLRRRGKKCVEMSGGKRSDGLQNRQFMAAKSNGFGIWIIQSIGSVYYLCISIPKRNTVITFDCAMSNFIPRLWKKKKKWVHTKRKQLMLLFTMAINVNLSGLGNSLWTPITGGGGAWDSGAAPRSRTANPRRESNPLGSRSVASTTVYVWGVMKINEAAWMRWAARSIPLLEEPAPYETFGEHSPLAGSQERQWLLRAGNVGSLAREPRPGCVFSSTALTIAR